ncbi:hypothetical protein KGY79_13615 [Candidatus Bipolaricaulota bacterium]|nr:hypothetical protein [Candidatus Bipolaricaulota bacterium]
MSWLIVAGILLALLISNSLLIGADTTRNVTRFVEGLEVLLPKDAFLRDYTQTTGTNKVLVLYILDYKIAQEYRPDAYITCPGRVNGQPIEGEYHLALVENDRMVNNVPLPTEG